MSADGDNRGGSPGAAGAGKRGSGGRTTGVLLGASRWALLLTALLLALAVSGSNGRDPEAELVKRRLGLLITDFAAAVQDRELVRFGLLTVAFTAAAALGLAVSYRHFRWRVAWFLVLTVAASAGFQSYRFQLALMAGLPLTLLATYRQFLGKLPVYALSHPSQASVLLVFFCLLYGLAGTTSYGVPSLFWYETPVGRFLSAMGSVLLLAVLGVNAYYLDDRNERNQQAIARFLGRNPVNYGLGNLQGVWLLGLLPRFLDWLEPGLHPVTGWPTVAMEVTRFLRLARLPFLTLVALPALYPLVFPNVPRLAPVRDLPRTLSFLFGEPPATFLGFPMPLFQKAPLVWLFRGLPDVGRDPRAWLLGLSLWVSGLLTGVIAVKIFVGTSAGLEGVYHRAVGPALGAALDWLVRVYQATVGPLFDGVGAALGRAYGLAIGRGPGVRGPTAQEVTAAASIAVVGLAVFLTWKVNTTEADPSHLTCLLAADYVAVGASLLAAAIWSGLRAYELRPSRWPPFFRFLTVSVLLYVLFTAFRSFVSPGMAVCSLLIVLSLFGGWLRQLRPPPGDPRRFRSDLVALVLVVIWVAVMNGDDVKMQFDGLSYDPSRRADWVGAVRDYHDWGNNGMDFRQHPPWKDPAPEGPQAEPGLRQTGGWPGGPPELHDDEAVLNNWRAALWRRTPQGRSSGGEPPPTFHPKLAVVCATGGASRAQYWTALLLDRLGHEMPEGEGDRLGFHDGVRLVTGASGGMVGAAYYLVWRDHVRDRQARGQPDDRVDWIADMPTETLPAVASHIALAGVAQALVPRLPPPFNLDRGQVLERQWVSRGREEGRQWETLLRPFRSFREREGQGEIPSVVFTPVTVDDGRRLLISNLGLEKIAVNGGEELGLTANRRKVYSVAALEFFRVFGKEGDGLTLATAARMSGSFPMVSPAVNLPTRPPVRVVDAGYYDNYGVNLAVAWIFQNRVWLKQHTSGVVLVQVRAFMGRKERLGLADPTGDRFSNGLQFVTTLFTAFLNARETTPMFRNDEEVAGLSDVLAGETGRDDFFATVIFENSAQVLLDPEADDDTWPFWRARRRAENAPPVTDVAMTWYLSEVEKRSMGRAIPDSNAAARWSLGADLKLVEVSPGRGTDSFLQRPDLRMRWLGKIRQELHDLANVPGNEPLRAFYIKELERALNYERLQALKSWWGRGY